MFAIDTASVEAPGYLWRLVYAGDRHGWGTDGSDADTEIDSVTVRLLSPVVWTATLTPGDLGTGVLGCNNGNAAATCSSTSFLSDDSFSHDSTAYNITALFVRSDGSLQVDVDADFATATTALTLVVGSTALVLADADTIASRSRVWLSSGVSLTAGTDIEVKLTASGTANTAAMGAPTITGTAQLGETLTAVTTGITDADGLTSPTYTYQWIRVDGTEADISGANSSTYTLVAADLGKTIKVKVSFTDDASNPETLTSAGTATGTVEVPDDWALKPANILPGERFRLIFASSETRDATSIDIADYNTFITTHAAAGVAAIQPYADDFTALVSTETVNARANTLTGSTDTDAPIYWVQPAGTVASTHRAADNYAAFYGGTWASGAEGTDESGTRVYLGITRFWTGTNVDGTTAATGFMGTSASPPSVISWLVSFTTAVQIRNTVSSRTQRIVGLSPVFQAAAAPAAVPGIPTGLTAIASGHSQINLTWTAPDYNGGAVITGYKIEVSPDGSSDWTDLVADTGSTAITYAHTGLTAATTRHYRVSAINEIGASNPSGSDDATTTEVDATPMGEVPGDWALKPADIGVGEQFRLMFFGGPGRDATSASIADYNTFVRTSAAAGVTAMQPYAEDFTALVSTQTVNVRTNTLTRATDTDVPIYWVRSGTVAADDRVADDYAGFYDGSWATGTNAYDQDGVLRRLTLGGPWTGSNTDGTTHSTGYMGAHPSAIYWAVLSGDVISSHLDVSVLGNRIAALSPVFQVSTTPFNSAPTGADKTVETAQDTAYAFMADDFGFADTDTDDTLDSVKIVTPPASGTLALEGTEVMADDVVTTAQLDAGDLIFTSVAGASGDPYTSFTFKVNDGTDDSAAAYTMSIAVNTAPTAADNTVATAQNTAYAFMAVDFGFADDDAGDTLDSVKIVTPPALGTLALDGTEVMADDVVTKTQLDAGDLIFTPVAGASGDPYASFTFKVNDGTDDSAADYTMSITVNTAPTAANNTVAMAQNTAYAFMADDFGFADDDAGDTLDSVKIVTPPALGTLALDGTEVMADGVVTKAQLDNGDLTFMPLAGATGDPYASFTFKVNDGTDDSAAAYTMSIAVSAAPTGADKTVETARNTAYAFMADDFGFADDDGDTLDSVKIITPPPLGTLALDGTEVMADDVVTKTQLDAGDLTFTPVDGASGKPYTSFTFKVNDGTLDSAAAYTMSIAVNTAPTGADNTVATARDTAYAFMAGDFGFADDDAGDTLDSVKIVAPPALGTLALDGTEVMADAVVTRAQIDGDMLTFTPVAGASGDPYTSFTFKVNDGTEDSAIAYTMSIVVNTAPTGADNTVTMAADRSYTFAADEFGFADTDAGDTLESVRIVTLPASGTLVFDGTAVVADDVVTKAQLDHLFDDLTFTPAAGASGDPYTSFTFKVNDGTDDSAAAYTMSITVNAIGAVSTAEVPHNWALKPADIGAGEQFRLMFQARWGHPAASANIATYNSHVRSYAGAGVTALRSYADDFRALVSTQAVNVRTNTMTRATDTDVPIYWVRSGTVAADDRVAANYADFYDGSWATGGTGYTAGGYSLLLDTHVSWTGSNANGTTHSTGYMGSSSDIAYWAVSSNGGITVWTNGQPSDTYFILALSSVFQVFNTAPTGADNTVTTGEDRAYTFTTDDFGFTDTDAGAALASVKIVAPPALGTLALDGTAVVADGVVSKTQIDADMLTFTPARDAHGALYTTFTFKVNDGTADSADAYTMTIDVTDAPAPVCTAPSYGDRREIWTGTVTVELEESPGFVYYGFNEGVVGTLLPSQSFSIGSNNYVIAALVVGIPGSSVRMEFSLDGNKELTDTEITALRLHVCDGDYDFSAAADAYGVSTTLWNTTLDWSHPVVTRTVYLSLPANNDATGEPAITGTAQVGQDLTADASPIVDDDGLTDVDFTYQWIRVDADGTSNEEDVSGEIAATYTLTDDDLGKKVKVKVSFTDELSGVEMRTSAAYPSSGTVTVAAGTNTPPTGANNTVTAGVSTAYAFTADDFGFADTDTGDTLASVKIVTLPSPGTLALDGTAVLADAVVTKAQIDGDMLTFTPVAGASGTGYASFTFKVNDGTDDSTSAYTMTIDVAASPASPTVSIAAPTGATDGFLYEFEAATEDLQYQWSLTRVGLTDAALTVDVSVAETGGGDFAADGADTVTFAVNKSAVSYTPITKDDVDEDHGTVTVTVDAGTGYDVDPDAASAALAVRDDDGELVTVTLDPATLKVKEGRQAQLYAAAETEEGAFDDATDMTRLFGATVTQASVEASTEASTGTGAATAGTDYTALAAETVALPFADFEPGSGGVLQLRVALPAIATEADEVDDPDETFKVKLAAPADQDARIAVSTTAATVTISEGPPDGAIRLCSGIAASTCTDVEKTLAARNTEGRVEVIYNDEWGTVCDDYWSNGDGNVACTQMGYPGAERVFWNSHFGGAARGTKMWLDNLQCVGDEDDLLECRRRGSPAVGEHNCSDRRHTEDAGVRCLKAESELHGAKVDPLTLTIAPGRTGRYWVSLTKDPEADVVVYPKLDTEAEAALEVTEGPLPFPRAQWNYALDVDVTVKAGAALGTYTVTHTMDLHNNAVVEDSDVTELTFAVPPVMVTVVASTSVSGPAPVSATVSGRDASVRFDAPLDASFAPSAADFAVLADGRRLALTGAWTAGRALLLELAEPATGAVRLAYVPSAAAPLGGRDGSPVSPFETLALAMAGGPADDAQDTITLDAPKLEGEPGLEAALADALRHAPGPVAATFAAPRRAVADLSALSALPELRRVNLAGNAVTDAGPLALLGDLERLDLSGNAVADLWPLSGLAELRVLDLSGNRVTDVTALAGLPRLRVLELSGNAVVDLSPLGALPALEYLGVAGNRVTDVTALANLHALTRLDLDGNAVVDAAPLGDAGRLVWLRLSGNRLATLDGLGRLTMLRWVWVADNPLPDATTVAWPERAWVDVAADGR